jgi:NTE family protein
MQESYNPDFLIGVNVSTKIFDEYPENDKKLISTSLLYMIMDKVDPKDLGAQHVFIEPDLEGITGFDFSKAAQIIDSGYVAAMRMIPEMLKNIEERKSQVDLKKERVLFKEKMEPLKFSEFGFTDFRPDEKRYIEKIINPLDKEEINIEELKTNYFKLIADPYFTSVFPTIGYIQNKGYYKFNLSSEGEENIRLNFGGNVASSGLSNLYLGAGFDHLNYLLFNHNAAVGIGQFYKSFQYKLKIQFPFGYQFYAEPFFKYNGWDFLNTGNFFDNRRVIPITQFDRNYGINLGLPIFDKMKLEFESSLLRKVNEYTNSIDYVTTDTLDFNRFYGLQNVLSIQYSNLNERVFPTEGSKIDVSLMHNFGTETYLPGSTSEVNQKQQEHNWFQFNAEIEKYYALNYGDIGFSLTTEISNLRSFANYRGTLLNSPTYSPTFESMGLYLENFRAPMFMAGGLKYQIQLYKDFNFRVEGHTFKPLIIWEENEAVISKSELTPVYYFSGMSALFYKSPIGPISISAHYYQDRTPFLLLFNIGYLMFNKKPLE